MEYLKEKYKDYFYIGVAVSPYSIKKQDEIIKKHFNSLTCENEMKYSSICPEPNKYNFKDADEIYSYAKKNNMKMRGHTLVWHNQTPKWLFDIKDREQLLHTLRKHMQVMIGMGN